MTNTLLLANLLFLVGTLTAAEPSAYDNVEAWRRAVPIKYQTRAEYAFVKANPALPNVLLIGDSISMQYTVGVQKRLAGVANVCRAPDNCRSTRQSLAHVDDYLGDVQWDVIHFNWGVHDITHLGDDGKVAPPPTGRQQVPLAEYRSNFKQLLQRLQATGAKLVWASTTPIGRKTEERGYRRDRDVVDYNAAAAKLTSAEHIPTNDLYRVVKSRAEELLSDGVHFNAQGQTVLAEAVAASILITLDTVTKELPEQSNPSATLPASKDLHVFLLMGQSNMVGRGELTRLPRDARVIALNQSGQWQPAVDPLHETSVRDRAGPGVSFARGMLHVVDQRITIGLVPCAVGGTPLSRWEKGGDLYATAIDRARQAMQQGSLAGVLWLQGEADSRTDSTAVSYAQRLDAMIAHVREDLQQPKLPFVAAQLCEEFPQREDVPGADHVMEALRLLPERVPNAAIVDSSGLRSIGDHTHFTTDGQRELGRRFAVAMARLLGHDDAIVPSELSTSARAILGISDEHLARLTAGNKQGLIELAPVHLPPLDAGDCDHFGWPIATMTGDTLIVMHRRIPGHRAAGAGEPDPSMSYGIVLHSQNGGQTWSAPYDLRNCMQPHDRSRGGLVPLSHRAKFDQGNKSSEGYKIHLHSIGTLRDGAVVAINNHGVFRSDNAGRTWNHFSTAFRDDTFPHPIVNLGPNLIDHTNYGLLAFGNWFGEVDSYHRLSNQLVALKSQDGGANWQVEEHDVGFPQYEPAAIFHEGRFHFVTRDQTHVRAHKQMSWLPGEAPQIVDTNLEDPRFVDTVDFCFNPVTRRLEIIRSERHRMQLWLWSMDPADWATGQWRPECLLIARSGAFYQEADGFHPAAAVLDEQRGLQHIFFYSGHPNGPAGVFRLSRTLDTPKLVGLLR